MYNYYLVKTRFHGGGIVSRHKTLRAAEKAAKHWRSTSCTCGCCGVVTAADYEHLIDADKCDSPYALCK
jgi:hypothetical protein